MPDYGTGHVPMLAPVDAVRKRPAMYIGGTDARGVHHLFSEVFDNAIDEVLAGTCDRTEVVLHTDGSLSVIDNGRGFDSRVMEESDLPLLEVAFTKLHPRWNQTASDDRYRVSGGLHGVGLFVVSALSEWVRVQTHNDAGTFAAAFSRGKTAEPPQRLESGGMPERGTRVTLKPDLQIFGEVGFTPAWIVERLRELAFLLPTVTLMFRNEQEKSEGEVRFHCPQGVRECVRHLNGEQTVLHEVIGFHADIEGIIVDGAFQYGPDADTRLRSYANTIRTPEGTHETAFYTGLTRALNRAARHLEYDPSSWRPLRRERSQQGLTAVISVFLRHPEFYSSTRVCLGSREVYGPALRAVYSAALTAFEADAGSTRRILDHLTGKN